MPTSADLESDSDLELSGKADSLTEASEGDESVGGEQGDEVDEEEVVEEEDEEEEEEEEEEGDEEQEEQEGEEEQEEVEEIVDDEEEEIDEVEEEEEAEEEAEEEEDEAEEEGAGEGDGEDADLSDSALPVDEDTKDTSQQIGSEGHDEDLKSVSSTPERSESNPTLITHPWDDRGGNFTPIDPAVELLAAHQEASYVNDEDARPAVKDKHLVSSGGNGFPESLVDNRGIEVQLEKKTSIGVPKDAKSHSSEVLDSHQPHLNSGDSIDAEHTKSLHVNENEKEGFSNDKSNGIQEKEVSPLHTQTDVQSPEDVKLSTSRRYTPQRRPRSPSPGATLENMDKKPAIICDFFVKGWCIKGNSCRFLHQKDGAINASQLTKADLAGPSRQGKLPDDTGSREEAERLKSSALHESPASSNTAVSSSKPQLLLQRALVRAYGGESHGLNQFHDDYNMLTSPISGEEFHKVDIPGSGRVSNPSMNELQQTPFGREEYRKPFGVLSLHESLSNERRSTSEEFLSGKYLNERKLPRYYSGGSSIVSSIYHNSSSPASYDERTTGLSVQNKQGHSLVTDSNPSYSLNSSWNPSFSNSLPPVRISHSIHTFAQPGTLSTHGSTPLSAEYLDTHKSFDCDRGYYGSRSSSLPRNSSPGDVPASGQKSYIQASSWEPSVPFRPSFYQAPSSISSPGSQYDPLLDSIEPPNTGNTTFQASQRTISRSISSQHTNGDPMIITSHSPAYNGQKPPSTFPQHEGILGNDTSGHGLSGYTVPVAAPGPNTVDVGDSSIPKEEKRWSAGHVVDRANANEVDLGNNPRDQADKGRNTKESKVLKIFRAALVDFVKELMKPSWREGHLSKDAHKMIVKKAVEKVLSALQAHQIPSTTEAINQYLSSSRPKLLKLVEGYVDKYAKS